MSALEWTFFISIALAIYPMAGYPLVIGTIGWLRRNHAQRAAWTPTISVLVPAHNEAKCIARTIENKLEQDYPRDKIEVIVVSDASDDGTDGIVRRYEQFGVRLLRLHVRQGKAAALNEAVVHARGEILVFSDANAEFALDAVRLLAENFADPAIGYVTGCLTSRHGSGNLAGAGASSYMRYENWLRTAESRAGSVIGVNGGVDAMRRSLYEDVPVDQITDFVLPLRVIAAGLRVVYDPRARSFENANEEMDSEFRMRVRVALRALRGLWYMRKLLNPVRFPFTSLCILSHKVLRYGTFLFMIAALLANGLLALGDPRYRVLWWLQLLVYGVGVLGVGVRSCAPIFRVTGVLTYFLASNAAFAVAAWRFARGDSMTTWRPRSG